MPNNIYSNPSGWVLPWILNPKGDTLSYCFEDWWHFQETLNERNPTWCPSDTGSTGKERHGWGDSDGWYMTKDWSENAALLRTGWAKEAENLTKYVERFEHEVLNGMGYHGFNYDTNGIIWDLDRYMSGEAECWLQPEPTISKVQGAQVILNLSASCGVDVKSMIAKGSACLALARILELAQIPTEVHAMSAIQQGWGTKSSPIKRITFQVPLKMAGEPCDYSRLAYGLAHPSMFRRSIFRLMEMMPDDVRESIGITSSGGYGRIEEVRESELPSGSHVIYVPAQGGRYQQDGSVKWDEPDEDKAEEWIERKLKLCGVHLGDLR